MGPIPFIFFVTQMIQNTWIVTNTEDNTLFLLGQTKTEIIASEGPRSMVWDPEKHLLYTTNSLANTVSIIDLTTGSKIDSPQIFDDPRGLALTSEGFSLYVVSKNTDEIIEVSTQNFEVLNRYKTGKSPRNIAIDPATDTFFVTNNGDDTVSILRSDDSHTIPVAKQPYGI